MVANFFVLLLLAFLQMPQFHSLRPFSWHLSNRFLFCLTFPSLSFSMLYCHLDHFRSSSIPYKKNDILWLLSVWYERFFFLRNKINTKKREYLRYYRVRAIEKCHSLVIVSKWNWMCFLCYQTLKLPLTLVHSRFYSIHSWWWWRWPCQHHKLVYIHNFVPEYSCSFAFIYCRETPTHKWCSSS